MSTRNDKLGVFLFGEIRGRILALLCGKPDEKYFTREIARLVGTSAGTARRELESLFRLGLVNRSSKGNLVFYQWNIDHPTALEIRSLIAKTFGVYSLLTSALAPLAPRIRFAFVYGSFAQGDEDQRSDVDLLVVGTVTLEELLEQLAPVERAVGRSINPALYSVREYKTKLHDANHFLMSIQGRKKIFLLGNKDDFAKLG